MEQNQIVIGDYTIQIDGEYVLIHKSHSVTNDITEAKLVIGEMESLLEVAFIGSKVRRIESTPNEKQEWLED